MDHNYVDNNNLYVHVSRFKIVPDISQIGSGQRHLIDHYSLKTRRFIGNTSMDAQLSLIMANMAKVYQYTVTIIHALLPYMYMQNKFS